MQGETFMQAREGDLIKTKDNIIFDVKGLVHPKDKVIAFPRYISSPQGARGTKGNLYGKVYNLSERFKFLKENAPELIVQDPVFGEILCEVPKDTIVKLYNPIEGLALLRTSKRTELEDKAVQLAEELRETANIPWSSIGVSGSVLVGLYTPKSDIDLIIYGVEDCRKVYAALKKLLKTSTSHFKPYTKEELLALFDFRSKDTFMSFEDFALVESRKAFQGKYSGIDYFIRFVKDWKEVSEQYGDVCYKNAGYARITATIADDSETLFTPCTYRLKNVKTIEGPKLEPIQEIASFRGRFCEQAKTEENITAQGKIEHVTDKRKEKNHEYYRIILGNKPEDYLILS